MTNTPTPEELMRLACEVRDEDNDQANTALRVGTLLASIVSALSAAYPYTNVSVSQKAGQILISYTLVPADGSGTKYFNVPLPAATTGAAGVMTAGDCKQVDSLRRTVRDLGNFPSVDAALEAAAAGEIVDNRDLRLLHWRADGDGGTILQSRWGGHYVTQILFMHGQNRETRIRQITGGGNYECGPWRPLILPLEVSYDAASREIRFAGLKQTTALALPTATSAADGLMPHAVYAALAGFDITVPTDQTGGYLQVQYSNPMDGLKKSVMLPAATTQAAGVMTAVDKMDAATALGGASARFSGIVPTATILTQSTMAEGGEVMYVQSARVFAYRVGMPTKYYNNWSVRGGSSARIFMNDTLTSPLADKVYISGDDLYTWDPAARNLVPVLADSSSIERLQGRDAASNAQTDPFLLLGTFRKEDGETDADYWGRINTAIDSTFSLEAGTANARYCGEMRISVSGQIITLRQIAIDYASGKYLQAVSGAIRVDEAGRIAFAGSLYNTFTRYIDGGVAQAWRNFVPQRQAGKTAAEGEYVYSMGTAGPDSVMSMKMGWEQKGGNLILNTNSWAPAGKTGYGTGYGVPTATTENAGAMSAADKANLDGYARTVRDLGTFSSVDAAMAAAGAQEIVDDRDLRILHWRTDGDGGTILQSRWGGHYVTQCLFMHGQPRAQQARFCTGGGNYSVGPWKTLLLPTAMTYDAPTRALRLHGMRDDIIATLPLPEATAQSAGLLSAALYQKIQQLETRLAALEAQAATTEAQDATTE